MQAIWSQRQLSRLRIKNGNVNLPFPTLDTHPDNWRESLINYLDHLDLNQFVDEELDELYSRLLKTKE